ncbi:nucleoside hydrolase [Candidatus Poribacteria bacterium]|nr:MAG: nucleoside hydrolase [Candidatus Poribacteria bacterium]
MHRILIDTDPGVDDALAILLTMKSPELRVEAITTVSGNVHVEQATQNLLTILGVLELSEFPIVAKGEAQPLIKPLVKAEHVHGEDGLGNISKLRNSDGSLRYPLANCEISTLAGVDLILEMVDRYSEELIVVALGPLTNISRAIQKDAESMQKLRSIVLMGGVFREYGNVTTTAEFNIFVDPHAAHEVFNFGIPVHIAPLDVTHQVVLTGERLNAEIKGRSDKISCFLIESTQACMEFYREHIGFYGLHIHDALPVGMLTHPAFFESVDANVQVETEGNLTSGMTVADLRRERQGTISNASVCVQVESDTFLNHFFQRVLS